MFSRHSARAALAAVVVVAALPLVSTATPGTAGPAEGLAFLVHHGGVWQVAVLDADRRAQAVTSSAVDKLRCSWLPSGREILATTVEGRVLRVDIQDRTEEAVDLGLSGIQDVAVSPDGRRLAFSFSAGGIVDGNDIWVARIDGAETRRLTRMPGLQHDPAWSPDGRFLYFLSGGGEQSHDVWRVAVDGDGGAEPITAGALYHFDVALSATGELAYSGNADGGYQIWTHRPPREPVRLTEGPGLHARPVWSRDASFLVFESTREHGGLALWRIDASGGAPERITGRDDLARSPCGWPQAVQ